MIRTNEQMRYTREAYRLRAFEPAPIGFAYAPTSPLDQSKTASGIVLSNSFQTMTPTGTNTNGQMSVSFASHASGKYYVTFTLNSHTGSSGTAGLGLVNGSALFAEGNFPGQDNNGIGIYNNGSWYSNNFNHPIGLTFSAGAVVGMAVDVTAQKVWWTTDAGAHWNNDVLANQNPVGDVGGISFSNISGAVFVAGDAENVNDEWTVNFAPNSPPAGYGSW
jgi:hypothetical protein